MSTDIFSLRLGINSSYLIRGVKGIIMVDAGTPNKVRAFKKKLARLYIRPQEIKLIVLTHSHFDHAGSAKDIQDLTGAKIVIHESEKTFLEEGGFIMPQGVNTYGKITRQLLFPFFKNIPFSKPKADIVLGDNDFPLYEYGVDGKIIHTPGHTHGSISILLDTGEAFVGCLAHNGLPFRLTPGLPIYAENINQVYESWQKLIARGARVIFPGHGRPFSVEIIKRQLK
jgi:glyoxylase-like metal-dependent hydrolase (beta-lactamase superfamily II)